MKAHISKSGTVAVWAGALPSSYDGWFLDITETEPPSITTSEVLSKGPLVVEWTDGVPVAVQTTWTTRPKTDAEARYKIAPLTLLDRLARPELKAVIAMAIGTTAKAVTDTQEGAWRLMLSLGATGELYSDGRASLVLPGLFGAQRAAELLAPDSTVQ